MRDFSHLFGIQLISSPTLSPQSVQVPKRVHKQRRRQSYSYHRRVQKKWNKRYGMEIKRTETVLQFGDRLVVSPTLLAAIRNAIPVVKMI